jgi:hypothetical protein
LSSAARRQATVRDLRYHFKEIETLLRTAIQDDIASGFVALVAVPTAIYEEAFRLACACRLATPISG